MMISPTTIGKLLVDRLTPNEGPRRRGIIANSCEEEIITSLLKMTDDQGRMIQSVIRP